MSSPAYALETSGWGWNSSRDLAARYSRDWLDQFDETRSFMRLGFAFYDIEDYEEGLFVFERMQEMAAHARQDESEEVASGETSAAHSPDEAFALIWQGHMLDLLGRREEAIEHYRQAADMNLDDTWQHGQYGLQYSLSPYATQRMESPFERVTNSDPS